MNLKKLIQIFSDLGCDKYYAKELAENDNSKQQIYLGANFQSISNYLPRGGIYTDTKGSRKIATFKADLQLYWLSPLNIPEPAPEAKVIWYTQYPEVRLSGFLRSCKSAPSTYMNPKKRLKGRILFFGIDNKESKIYCYLGIPGSDVSKEFLNTTWIESDGIFIDLLQKGNKSAKSELLSNLLRIYRMGLIDGCKMNSDNKILKYVARNAGGTTLEAMFGIPHNSKSDADFLGWEIKHFATTAFEKTRGKRISLFTSEPDLGLYHKDYGKFMVNYGSKKDVSSRYDFTGQHVAKLKCQSTGLRMLIEGFNFENNSINKADGKLLLLDEKDKIAAGWSFPKLLDHWERKHASACYVPGIKLKNNKYAFGNHIILGIETSFLHFITALNYGIVFYDPGNKVSIKDGKHSSEKRRNQFRMSTSFLGGLYRNIEEIDITTIE